MNIHSTKIQKEYPIHRPNVTLTHLKYINRISQRNKNDMYLKTTTFTCNQHRVPDADARNIFYHIVKNTQVKISL